MSCYRREGYESKCERLKLLKSPSKVHLQFYSYVDGQTWYITLHNKVFGVLKTFCHRNMLRRSPFLSHHLTHPHYIYSCVRML